MWLTNHVCFGIICDSYRWWTVTFEPLLHDGMSFSELGVLDSERDCLWVEAGPLAGFQHSAVRAMFALGSFVIPIVDG